MKYYNTLPTQCRHIKHIHKGTMCNLFDKLTAKITKTIIVHYSFCKCIDSAIITVDIVNICNRMFGANDI